MPKVNTKEYKKKAVCRGLSMFIKLLVFQIKIFIYLAEFFLFNIGPLLFNLSKKSNLKIKKKWLIYL